MIFKPKSMIALAVLYMGITVALRLAERGHVIDGDTGTRAFMVFLGLIVIAFGNAVPKQLKRLRTSIEAERRTQAALRAVGWAMTLAGFAVCAVWTVAPEAIARIVSLSALGGAFVLTVVTGLACRNASRAQRA